MHILFTGLDSWCKDLFSHVCQNIWERCISYLKPRWDEKAILKKSNPPSVPSSFLGWDRCQKSPHKFAKSGHCRILLAAQVPFRAICVNVEENKKWRTGHFKVIYTLMRIFFYPFWPFFWPFQTVTCDFLKILQCPDFANLWNDFWHLSHAKKLDESDGGFSFFKNHRPYAF